MLTLKLKELLDEFEEWVAEGRAKKIPYQEWRYLKQHAEDQVRIERDSWGDLGVFSETCCKFLIEGWQYDDGSLGTYLDNIYIHEFDKCLTEKAYTHSTSTSSNANYEMAAIGKQCKAVPAIEITEKGINIQGQNVIDTISEKVNEAIGLSINRKENNDMNLFKGFDFGTCENDNVKISMYGIAVKNATDTWVSYDAKSGSVVDVDILNFDAKYLYKIPVAIKDIKESDVIIHNRKPMFVTRVEGGKVLAIDPAAGEEKVILLTRSPFGFDFIVKVINLFGDIASSANANAPFGNVLPLMLLADDNKSEDMLPLIFAMNGGKFDMSNPMMLYLLVKNDKNSDMLPLMLAMNGSFNAPTAVTGPIAS